MNIRRKSISSFLWIVNSFVIAGFVVILSFVRGLWERYPAGADGAEHLTIVKYLLDWWPHSRWHYIWAAGMPFHLWYAPLPHYVAAVIVKISGFSIEFSLSLMAMISYLLIGIGLYASTFEVTKSHKASLLSSSLALSSPVLWSFWGGGTYTRVLAMAFFSFAIWSTLRYSKDVVAGNSSRKISLLLFSSIAATILSHLMMILIVPLTITFITLSYGKGWIQRITITLKAIVPSMLISSYFIIPFILSRPASHFYIVEPIGADYKDFFLLSSARLSLSPFLLALVPICLAIFIKKRSIFSTGKYSLNALTAFGLISTILYSLATILYFGYAKHIYLILPPPWVYFAFATLSCSLSLVCGIVMGPFFIRKNVTSRLISKAFAILLMAIMITAYIGSLYETGNLRYLHKPTRLMVARPLRDGGGTYDTVTFIGRLLENSTYEKMYRFGTTYAGIASWFNYQYAIPQSRDHESTCIVNRDWRFWLDYTTWTKEDNYQETNYALDWFAVKWFVVVPVLNVVTKQIEWNYQKFLNRPQYYNPVTVNGNIYGFTYGKVTPIVFAINGPIILVIGSDVAYNDLFRGLAYADYNSRYVIPVRGKEYIDSYTLEELSGFDVLFLYNYKYHEKDMAWSLLRQYVNNGGGLIIETMGSPDFNASYVPLPSPVNRTFRTDFGYEWDLTAIDSPITHGVEFSMFSLAILNESGTLLPWGVSASYRDSIQPWAEVVLSDKGLPIVVVGKYGRGHVVWSGLNIPHHAALYKNYWESLFISKMIGWVSQSSEKTSLGVNYTVDRQHPEKVKVTITNKSSGVLFKEFYFKNWYAYLIDTNGKKHHLDIHRAGPDFMYVSIPQDTGFPIDVVFEYGVTLDEWIGRITSITAFILVIAYAIGLPIDKPAKSLIKNLNEKMKEWWYEE